MTPGELVSCKSETVLSILFCTMWPSHTVRGDDSMDSTDDDLNPNHWSEKPFSKHVAAVGI